MDLDYAQGNPRGGDLMTTDIMWASSDAPSPEKLEALDAARDILMLIGMAVGPAVTGQIADRILTCAGATERRAYDLGWRHCSDAIRD
jgi:hypothetical protein